MKTLPKAMQKTLALLREKEETAFSELETAWERWQAVVAEVVETRQEVADLLQGYADRRGDNWHDSDKGQAFADWISAWEEDLDQHETDRPEALDWDSESFAVELEV